MVTELTTCSLTAVGSNATSDLRFFMWGCYPASLRNIDGSTQVPARAWNNAWRDTWGLPPPVKLEVAIYPLQCWCDVNPNPINWTEIFTKQLFGYFLPESTFLFYIILPIRVCNSQGCTISRRSKISRSYWCTFDYPW